MGFGATLRRLREAAGLTQPQLAERAGLSVDSVQNWEQGRTSPRVEALGKLAGALGTTIDELLADGGKDPRRPRGRPAKSTSKVKPAPRRRKPKGA